MTFKSRDEVLKWVAKEITKPGMFHCCICWKWLKTMEEMHIPENGEGIYCSECYEIERIELISKLNNGLEELKEKVNTLTLDLKKVRSSLIQERMNHIDAHDPSMWSEWELEQRARKELRNEGLLPIEV